MDDLRQVLFSGGVQYSANSAFRRRLETWRPDQHAALQAIYVVKRKTWFNA